MPVGRGVQCRSAHTHTHLHASCRRVKFPLTREPHQLPQPRQAAQTTLQHAHGRTQGHTRLHKHLREAVPKSNAQHSVPKTDSGSYKQLRHRTCSTHHCCSLTAAHHCCSDSGMRRASVNPVPETATQKRCQDHHGYHFEADHTGEHKNHVIAHCILPHQAPSTQHALFTGAWSQQQGKKL